MPLDAAAWGIDALYSCSQKGLGAPSGLAPVMFGPLLTAIITRLGVVTLMHDRNHRLLVRSNHTRGSTAFDPFRTELKNVLPSVFSAPS